MKPVGEDPEESFDFPEPHRGEEFSDSYGALACRVVVLVDWKATEENDVAAVPGSIPPTTSSRNQPLWKRIPSTTAP